MKDRFVWLLLLMASAPCLTDPLWAQQNAAQQIPEQPVVVVVRFDGRLLKQVIDRQISRTIAVRRCVLDAWCVGTADVTGDVSLDFSGGTISRISIKVTGLIDSRTRGYLGPVVSTARTRVPFRSDLAIGFDGEKFFPLPSSASACSQSTLQCIRTRRGGIGNRLVSRIAWCVAPGQVPKYDAAGSRMVEREVVQAADQMLGDAISQLNEFVNLESTLVALAATKGYDRQLSKTDQYLQVRIAPSGTSDPTPPRVDTPSDAPVEIWIYPNENRPPPAHVALLWQHAPQALRNLIKLPKPLAKLDQEVKLDEVGQWDVIRVGRFVAEKEL